MNFNLCDDPHYGYREDLLSVSGSFDEAKAMLDAHVLEFFGEDGVCEESFIFSIQMTQFYMLS